MGNVEFYNPLINESITFNGSEIITPGYSLKAVDLTHATTFQPSAYIPQGNGVDGTLLFVFVVHDSMESVILGELRIRSTDATGSDSIRTGYLYQIPPECRGRGVVYVNTDNTSNTFDPSWVQGVFS